MSVTLYAPTLQVLCLATFNQVEELSKLAELGTLDD